MALIDGALELGVGVSDTLFDLITSSAQVMKGGVRQAAGAIDRALPSVPFIHEPITPRAQVPYGYMPPAFQPAGMGPNLGGPRQLAINTETGRILVNA